MIPRRSSPAAQLRRTPRRLTGSSCNNSLLDQSLEIVWDNNSPSPTRTLSLGTHLSDHTNVKLVKYNVQLLVLGLFHNKCSDLKANFTRCFQNIGQLFSLGNAQ